MRNDRHSAAIIIKGQDYSAGAWLAAYISGIPDQCDHDDNGDIILFSKSGKHIFWHTYRQWASLTSQARQALIFQHHEHIDDPIMGGCVSCSKCKKPWTPVPW